MKEGVVPEDHDAERELQDALGAHIRYGKPLGCTRQMELLPHYESDRRSKEALALLYVTLTAAVVESQGCALGP